MATTDDEAWDDDSSGADSYPQLALIAGVAIVAMMGFLVANLIPDDPLTILPWVLIGAAVFVTIVWAAAWFVTLRHAAIGWKVGAAIAFLATASGAIVFWCSMATAAARIDVERLRQLRVDVDGVPQLPDSGSPGPLSRLGLTYVNDVMAERARRDIQLERDVRLEGMTNPATLTAKPELLTDCGRFTRGKAEIDTSDRRIVDRATQFRQALAGAIGDAGLRRTTLAGFDKGWGASRSEVAEMSGLRKAQLEQLVGMCAVLARRHWRSGTYFFEFSSGSDNAEFNRIALGLNDNMRKQRERRGDTINRINARLEIAGDTRF